MEPAGKSRDRRRVDRDVGPDDVGRSEPLDAAADDVAADRVLLAAVVITPDGALVRDARVLVTSTTSRRNAPKQQRPLGFVVSHEHSPAFERAATDATTLDPPVRSISSAMLSAVAPGRRLLTGYATFPF